MTHSSMSVGVLLAAGRSARFKSTRFHLKQLATLSNGATLLETSAKNLRASVDRLVIIVSQDEALREHAALVAKWCDAEMVVNAHAHDGMATSIACGVKVSPDATGWLIALADMPYILPVTYAAIAGQLNSPTKIIVPTYEGKRGHPIAFGAAYVEALSQLKGDTGAREVIDEHRQHVVQYVTLDAGILVDIDEHMAHEAIYSASLSQFGAT